VQTLASGYATQKVSGHPKTDIVVSIVRIVPVAISTAEILWIVIPRPATKHTNTLPVCPFSEKIFSASPIGKKRKK